MVDDPAEENQCASPSLSFGALQHALAPEVVSIPRFAYRYYGSVALLSQVPSKVDKNVDKLAIFILGK
jgi:hypothetical protein